MITEQARQLYERYTQDWEMMGCYERSNLVVAVMDLAKEIDPQNSNHQAALMYLDRVAQGTGIWICPPSKEVQ